MTASLWANDVRHWLILLNIVAFAGLIIYLIFTVLSPKKSREVEKAPANLTPFLPDDDLEGRRLERVQGWALLFAAVIAIALPIYWLREPTRQSQSAQYFDRNSVQRGAVLFARPGTPNYNAAVSLQCANCHGDHGEGGTAPTTINGQKVAWKAPPLNTEALRFTEDPACLDQAKRESTNPPPICEMTDIITFGRPGTPMQAWGIEGGGPKNDQSIADLVAYIESIQLTPAQAKAQATAALEAAKSTDPNTTCPEYMTCPAVASAQAQKQLDSDTKTLDDKRKTAQDKLGMPGASDDDLTSSCNRLKNTVSKNPNSLSAEQKQQALACGDYLLATNTVQKDQQTVAWTREWQRRRANVSDGQLLFEYACARCHTQGWSTFDPTAPPSEVNGVNVLGLAGGGGGTGGGIGFNLRGGSEQRRFGDDASGGWQEQVDFVTMGSDPFKPYGNGGIGSGRMPGFGNMLNPDQIGEIVSYERDCLDTTTFTGVTPTCETSSKAPPTTSTTTAPKAGG
jgi:mono/diheme cytochrome c family protein